MINPLDIAYLAGVFDGEGCVHVQRTKRKARGGGTRIVSSITLVIANTSAALVERCVSTLRSLGVRPNVYEEPKYGTRTIYFVKVQRKKEALVVAKALVEYAHAKRSEIQLAIWYLERSCSSRQHYATEQDVEVLDTISKLKRGNHMPTTVKKLLDN
jgi:hypothetical protein